MILNAGLRISLCVCMLVIASKYVYSLKINSPVVLLAYNKGLSSNYTLEITEIRADECFEWKSTNPEIVRVTPVFSVGEHFPRNCSKKAIVSSVAYLLDKRVTQVTATLLGGDKTFKCHVITDIVSRIELEFLRSELELEGPPEKLSVIAKDKEGHVFSSINGLKIRWKIGDHYLDELSEFSTDENSAVRISRFETSDYESPESEDEFERRGVFSKSVLVEPFQLGSSDISASLLFSSKPVLHTEVTPFKVVSSLILHPPSPLNLVRLSSIQPKIKYLYEDESLENFNVVNANTSVVSLEEDHSYLIAKEYGVSTITYESFRISLGDYRTLEEMKIYEFFVDLYDENKNIIYPTDSLRFSVKFPTKLFHVIYTTANGTYSVVQTIAPGSGNIRAEFKGIVSEDESISKDYTVSGSIDVIVCQRLTIFPPVTLLPVSEDFPMQIIPLTVSGGTGEYVWALSNNTAATAISTEDKRRIQLHVYDEIDLTVIVTDKNNLNFITSAKVSVQTPLDIETYPSVTESEIGNVLIVPTALLGYEDKEKDIIRKFDDCSKADIEVDIIEKYVLTYEKEAHIAAFGKGCMSLQFRCKMAGHSRVNMEYNVKNSTFRTTTMLSCFKPLKPVHPVRVGVLALGTAMDVAFEGGPRKWPLYKAGHYADLEASNPDAVEIQLIKDPVRYNKDLTVFRVTCKDLAENTLTLRIGNHPSATIQNPAKSEASIKFICAEPDSLHLKLYRKKGSKQLKDDSIVKVPFYGEKTFSIDIFLKDTMGRKFANISSLRVTWDVSDKALANPVSDFDFFTHENAVSGYRKLTRNFNEFKMLGPAGDMTVEAKISSYRKDVLYKEGIKEYKEIGEISRSIHLKLVSLRDINAGLYEEAQDKKDENGYCENDSCKS